MSPQEERLLRNAAQIALNVRAIHEHGIRAALPLSVLCETGMEVAMAEEALGSIVGLYLHHISRVHPMQHARPGATP